MACGYEENFVNPVDEDFHCLICHLPLREPVQTKCGHRFCKSCLERHMSRQESQGQLYACPLDRKNLDCDKDIFPDKAMERKILSYLVKCPSEGCDWTGELRNKESHLTSCCFQLVSCFNEHCEVTATRKDIEEHVTAICEWRVVQCGYCAEAHPKCLEEGHLGQCDKLPVACPDGCGTVVVREKIPDHLSEDCPLTEISCPYYEMGCNKKVQRKRLESHLESSARFHLDLACVKLHKTQREFKETTRKLEEKVENLQKKLEEKVIEKVNTFETKLQEKVSEVQTNLTSKIEKIQIDNYVLRWQISDLERKEKNESLPPPFIWKITGFREIVKDAKRNTAIESAPFFTGANGYKLKITMKPNGDLSRSGKSGYISLYIVVMRGKYDAILPWPFKHTVIFRLIDQQRNEEYREDEIMELVTEDDQDNKVFHRPTTDENSGYGFPKFISHDKLRRRRYIVDDTVFLEVQVKPPQS